MKTQQSPHLAAPLENDVDLAVIGMACRFPGARNVEEFWKNLAAGVESITRLSDEELLRSGVSQSLLDNPNYVKAAPILDDPGFFDAAFFGFSPAEARAMDPQHRVLLELAYEALENAGCNQDRFSGRVGVFTGSAMNTYFMNSGLSNRFAEDYIPTLIVNDKDFLSTRISYKLNLKGPSITVQTACSTSLVAVHLARQSLLSGETDMVLAGAISVRVPHYAGYFCDGGGVVSPDGHVRAFDANANGTVFGSGGGMIVLKRLADAIASGDTIHAVIKGSAVNNDGCEKAGYTAPSVNSQADAVLEALGNAGIDAESIGYIEAHGSGTPVGDPIEIAALTKAFRAFTERSGYCAIGSVKTNVGHLDAAAGIASVIKTVLALKHRQLPPSLHYKQPNPEIDFCSTPFFVNTELVPWRSNGPRRAGVMSTGMGGTNAHVVLEEAPALKETASSAMPDLLVLSAKSATALDAATNQLHEFLSSNAAVKVEDVAYTLQTGRKAFSHRRALVCASREDAIMALDDRENSKRTVSSHSDESTRRPIVFLLPGVGDHYVGMGRDLYEKWEVFRDEVDRCAVFLQAHLDVDLREIIYPNGCKEKKEAKTNGIDLKKMLGQTSEPEDSATQKLNQTIYAQPILFTIEYALARLWEHLGILPDAILGHSMGEYVAACLAGVFSLEDALWLIAQRAKRANKLPRGAMLAVLLSEAEIRPLLGEQLSISLINGPNLCVVAGPVAAVGEFERTLNERGIISRQVKNAHAFHSRMLDPIVPAFAEDVRKVHLHEPKIPFISNVTGKWITKEDATDPQYWAKHLNRTARFSDALQQMWQLKDAILLEVGPGKTLAVLASQHPDRRNAGDPVTISSLRHHYENQPDVEFLYHSIAKLWLSGIDVVWENFPCAEQQRKVPLPTYPFERQNYWLETIRVSDSATAKSAFIHKNPDLSKWFYVPSWKRTLPNPIGTAELSTRVKQRWVVFSDDDGLGSRVVDRLKAAGQQVVTVKMGETYQQVGRNNFILGATNVHDYELLIQTLSTNDWVPDHVIHTWSLATVSSNLLRGEAFRHAQGLGFYSLLFLAKAMAKQGFTNRLNLFVLSRQIQDVHGNELLSPEKSTVLGPCMVIPQEYPNIRIKSIDLESSNQTQVDDLAIDQIFGEFFKSDWDLFVAYRSAQRWVQTFEQVELERPSQDRPAFRGGGVYLITGGLGNVGCEISKHLAKNYGAKLALLGRSQLPKRKLWNAWIQNHPADDPVADKIGKIKEIERLGGEVLYLEASVHDLDGMRRAIANAREYFGELNGVIHGAGIIGADGYREVKDVDLGHCDIHFQAKAHGLQILETVLNGEPLDFCLLLSSLTSILGGIGQAAYAASNVYMDTFARCRNRSQQPPWLSVNWDVWRLENDTWGAPWFGKTLAELGMTADEALSALQIALSFKNTSQLIVSTGNLEARIRQWIKLESVEFGKRTETDQFTATEYKPAADAAETEKVVGQIWQEVLGINQIDLNDNFSDLGGHSLLAIKIVAELRKTFRIELPVRALFEAPTIAELSAYIKKQRNDVEQVQSIEPVRADSEPLRQPNELLEQLQKENPELKIEDAFVVPDWFMQQRTWLENPYSSDSAVYNYPGLLRICGPLNQATLEWALHEIVRRHQVLRSVFRIRDGEMVQIVVAPQRQDLCVTDLSDLPKAESEIRWQQIASAKANQPFDLTGESLLRTDLIRFAAEDHILQLTTHHLVHDDWSTAILFRELWECYQAFDSGKTAPLADLTFQYGDFVRWQQEQFTVERLNTRLSYWKQQLNGATGFQHVGTDFPRPAAASNRGARERARLPTGLANALQELSRDERVSLFMVLLAGFQCLLHRYSNHEEIGIGTCAANRILPQVEGLIGHFGNDMLLHTNLSGNPTFRELLVRVRETALSAYSNQDLPFGTLLRRIGNGNADQNAPFQTMFILQNAPQQNGQVPGLKLNRLPLDTGTAKYDLIAWLKTEPGLEITLEYKTDLFRAATMQQLLDDYQTVLQTITADPEMRIGSISLSRKPKMAKPDLTLAATKSVAISKNGSVPADEVEARLVELWEAAFNIRPIGVGENFFELGGDSLLAARLFAQMEKSFHMDLPLAMLLEAPTISQLARIISGRNSRSLGSSLVAIQTDGTRPPLFCVHGHMGEVFYCRNLSRSLGSDQPLYGLRSQGLRGEPLHQSVEEMAVHYVSEIRKVQPHGPYFLSGFCLGGMVAFEMAKLLRARGEEIPLLVLFNAPSPGGLEGWPLNRIYLTKRIAHELKKLRQLPMRQKLAIIGGKTTAFVSLVSGVFKTALWRVLPISAEGVATRLLSVADINVAAAKSYYPTTAYPGRITLFLTEEVASLYATDPTEGWRNLAQDGIEIHQVAGDNNSVFDVLFVDSLAEKLQSCIDNANGRGKISAPRLVASDPDGFIETARLVPTQST